MIVNTFSKKYVNFINSQKTRLFHLKNIFVSKYKTVMSMKGINKNDLPRQVVFIIVGCKII